MADTPFDQIINTLESGGVPDENELQVLRDDLAPERQSGEDGAFKEKFLDGQRVAAFDPSPIHSQLATQEHGLLVGRYDTPEELELRLGQLGISGAMNRGKEYPYTDAIEAEAARLYGELERDYGLKDVQGQGATDLKRRLLIGTRTFVRVRDTHWEGPERDRKSAAMFDLMLDEQMAREYEQMRGRVEPKLAADDYTGQMEANRARKLLEEGVANKAAAVQILKSQPEAVKGRLVRMALARAKPATNPAEEDAKIQTGTSWWGGRLLDDAALNLNTLHYYLSPNRFVRSDSVDLDDLRVLTRQVLGTGAEGHIARAYEQTRVNHFAHHLGIIEKGDAISTGYSHDGLNVFDFLAPGLVQELASLSQLRTDPKAKAASLALSPEDARRIKTAESYGDLSAAKGIAADAMDRYLEHTMRANVRGTEMGTVENPVAHLSLEGDPRPLTSVEERNAGFARQIQVMLGELGLGFLNRTREVGKETDAAIAAIPGVRETAQMAVRAFGGHRSTAMALAEDTKTLGDALQIGWRMAMDNGGEFFRQRWAWLNRKDDTAPRAFGVPEPVVEFQENPVLRALGPAGVRAILELNNDPIRALQAKPSVVADSQLRRQRLDDMWDEKIPMDRTQATVDLAVLGIRNTMQGFLDAFGLFAASPAEGGAILLGGMGAGSLAQPIWDRWKTASVRVQAGRRLERQVRQLVEHFPETTQTFLENARRAVQDAVDMGKPADVTDRLQSAVAALELVRSELRGPGAVRQLDATAQTLVTAWSDLRGYLGDMGIMLGTKNVDASLWERLKGAYHEAMGRPTRPDKALEYHVRMVSELGNRNVEAMRQLVSLPDNDAFNTQVSAFHDAQGRWPTADETRHLWPEPVYNLESVILSGKRASDIRDPLKVRALRPVLGRLNALFPHNGFWRRLHGLLFIPQRLLGMVDASENLVSAGVQAAIDTISLEHTWRAGVWARRDAILQVAESKVRQRLEALDVEEQFLSGVVAQAKARKPKGPPEVMDRLQQIANQRLGDEMRRDLLTEYRKRLDTHDARQPFRDFDDVRDTLYGNPAKGVRGEIDPETMGMILDAVPGRFNGLTSAAWWRTVPRPLSRGQIQQRKAARAAHNRAQVSARAAQKNPLFHDQVYTELVQQEQKLASAIQGGKKAGNPDDPVLQAKWTAAHDRRTARARDLQAGKVQPTEAIEAAARAGQARAELGLLERRLKTRRELNPKARDVLRDQLRHDGSLGIFGTLERIEGKIRSVEAARRLLLTDNYFRLVNLPMWLRGQALQLAPRQADLAYASHVARLGPLLDEIRRLPVDDYTVLNNALIEGRLPSELVKRYPQIQARWAQLVDHTVDPAARLDRLFKADAHLLSELHEAFRRSGAVPEEVLQSWETLGYDPGMYGLFLRGPLTTERLAKDVQKAAKGGVEKPAPPGYGRPVEGEHLKFRRMVGEWRYRIQTPEGVENHYFSTQAEANAALAPRFGQNPIRLQRTDGKITHAETPYGDKVTIGEPITPEELYQYDPIRGRTPEARLHAVEQGFRDLAKFSVTEAFASVPGMVLDDIAMAEIKRGSRHQALVAQYEAMPNLPHAFGSLAGKYVHKSALATLRRAAQSYDTIHSMVAGMREALSHGETSYVGALANRLPDAAQAVLDGSRKVLVQTQVLLSPATWATNAVTQVFCDYLAGSRVFSSDSLDTWDWILSGRYRNDPLYGEARSLGFVDGFFPEESGRWRHSLIGMSGLDTDNKTKLTALHARRQKVYDAAQTAIIDGAPPEKMVALERENAAIHSALREANMARWKKAARWGLDWFYGGLKDNLGRPANTDALALRSAYNFIDEGFKLMQYRNLRLKGLTKSEAAWRIRQFSQNYAQVPYFLRNMPFPFSSAIVSFPYEAARITKNALMYEPLKTAAFFSAIPMLNFSSLARAGVPWDRFMAMLEARGARDGMSALSRFMFSLFTFDDRGDMGMEVDLGGWFALGNLVRGRGSVMQLYNEFFPPEERSLLGHLMAAPVGFASNFVGNHPINNFLTQLFTGNDPVTGRPILDKTAKPLERASLAVRSLVQWTLPFSRAYMNWERADDEVVQPVSGRPFQRPYKLDVIMRTLTGVGMKGDLSGKIPLADDINIAQSILYRVAQTLDPVRRLGEYPTEGLRSHKREALYRAIDEARTDEERAKSWAAVEAYARETVAVDLGFMKRIRGRTDREVALDIKKMMQSGPEQFFRSLPINAQAAAVVEMDHAKVGDSMIRDMVDTSMRTLSGRLAREQDPQLVLEAIGYLKKGVENPNHNKRLAPWLKHLEDRILPGATRYYRVERQRTPRIEKRQETRRQARREKQ